MPYILMRWRWSSNVLSENGGIGSSNFLVKTNKLCKIASFCDDSFCRAAISA
ncbi:uncharacterized protein G2W53_024764 [Senna tora]|uniref:Uncharacterized protein n=1 Tax=Senna tora TaxID=362788 RepID=A0A834TDE9_9FABA|nr:uncharacterized protein G2W53_024764 [Senna tora]